MLLGRVGPVDVVICDLRMEGMGGLEFIHRAAQLRLIGAVVLSSGLSSEMRRALARLSARLGVSFLGDVGKPLHLETLRDMLARVRPRSAALLALPAASGSDISVAEVRRGLANHEFEACYLPRCDLGNGEIRGVDVVAQWNHPREGVLAPNRFMPLMAQGGLLDELLATLLEQGLALQRQLLDRGRMLRMSFSLELVQLEVRGLTRRIRSLMQLHRSAGQGIGFVLALGPSSQCSALHMENLIGLHLLGCGLCLGEFGAEGGSLQWLCRLPFNEIKLSRQFMGELEHQPRHRAVIRSSLALAGSLGLRLTVTGVDSAEQHLILMDLGCSTGQGSHFAPLLVREALVRRIGRKLRDP